MQRVDDAADDAFGASLLDVGGDGKGGLEALADGNDDGIAFGHRDFFEDVDVGAVGGDQELEFVLHRLGVGGVVVDADDFMSVAGELTGEMGAKVAEADDAEAHGEKKGKG